VKSHGLLVAVLIIQAGLSLRLSNTACNDEATYLNVGHAEIAHLLHSAVIPNFDASLSGAPFIYPVLAAAVDSVGGLELVRGLSLGFMLLTTALVFGSTRRIFGWAAAVLGSATFAVAAPVLFLGHLATYDAMTVFLLALAFWLGVLSTEARVIWGWMLALSAGLAAGLGGATAYAGLLFIPTILVASFLSALRFHGVLRSLARVVVPFGLGVGGLLLWITVSAPRLLAGLQATTINRKPGSTPQWTIIGDAALYVGGMLLLALAGVLVLVRRRARVEQQLLGVILAVTGLLAPLEQLHFHTYVSLQKHVGYSLVFVAPMVGVALAGAMEIWRRRMLVPLIVILLTLISLGANTSQSLFAAWPNTTNLLQLLRTKVQAGPSRYLVEEAAVPEYYFADITHRWQWVSTSYFQYRAPVGPMLTGAAAFKAGIMHASFEVIALSNGPTKGLDVQLERTLESSHTYQLIAKLPYVTSFGPGIWQVWQRLWPPGARSQPKTW
jgi:4-amino-4-deoxy-L-arabinose transferase-like glycosyltransferase